MRNARPARSGCASFHTSPAATSRSVRGVDPDVHARVELQRREHARAFVDAWISPSRPAVSQWYGYRRDAEDRAGEVLRPLAIRLDRLVVVERLRQVGFDRRPRRGGRRAGPSGASRSGVPSRHSVSVDSSPTRSRAAQRDASAIVISVPPLRIQSFMPPQRVVAEVVGARGQDEHVVVLHVEVLQRRRRASR